MPLGPNTNAPLKLLSPQCILCLGEDVPTLLDAARDAEVDMTGRHFKYRCYEFWSGNGLLVAWSGIGTGCIEPLLWELFQPGIVQQIVLVGTAGRMPESATAVGKAYLVDEAWLAGTGLDGENLPQPLRPRWPGEWNCAAASSVSTDFFYGFSPRILTGGYPFASGRLRAAYEEHARRKTGLVEMEVAQFYAFCGAFPNGPRDFIAVKGMTNTVGKDEAQVDNSRQAIAQSIGVALKLLKRD